MQMWETDSWRSEGFTNWAVMASMLSQEAEQQGQVGGKPPPSLAASGIATKAIGNSFYCVGDHSIGQTSCLPHICGERKGGPRCGPGRQPACTGGA